jgi:DNA-directed RNA polymerase specialized sigma24 family protein
LKDREGLWRLLLVITTRKVAHRHRHDLQERRDVRRTLTDSIFSNQAKESAGDEFHQLPSREPAPEFAAAFVETCHAFFQSLDDPQLQEVAALRIEGFTDAEIGQHLRCSRRTVLRRLEIIRRQLQRLQEVDV